MRHRHLALSLTVLSLLVAGCLPDSGTGPVEVPCDPLLLTFTPAPADTVVAANGLRHVNLRAGAGAAAASGDIVEVHYALYTTAGTLRERSCAGGTTFTFVTGTDQVIPGFWQGVIGMQEGGVRRVIVPPALGYGPIPGHPLRNETLVFDIQLVDIRNR
jgi:FKBP-type peptidyl-prolyl cis-trans isomerase FkpA